VVYVEDILRSIDTMETDPNFTGNYLTTDVISKVIFSTTWDLLTSTKNHAVVDASTTIVKFVGITHQSALFYKFPQLLALFIPKIASSQPQLGKYMRGMIAKRIEMEKDNPDIKDMFSIYKNATDPESSAGEKLTEEHLRFNSGQLIVAGSDTSAAAIAATLFYLSRDSKAYAKVAHEVRNTFSSLESIRAGPALNNCIYLRSSVNETLRMTPVATQPFWREPDAGGTSIAGEHIPSGVNVGASLYTLHHTEVVFPEPYKYNIERWIPRNDAREEIQRIKMMNRYFAPFLTGPRQCIAKNFAQMELLLTIANIFWRFDFQKVGRLGEGGKGLGRGRQRIGEFQFKSHFTSHIEGPMVRFRKREGP
jgi:cytochrome P450